MTFSLTVQMEVRPGRRDGAAEMRIETVIAGGAWNELGVKVSKAGTSAPDPP